MTLGVTVLRCMCLTLGVAFTIPANAEVYRCTDKGKVTYTDAPCKPGNAVSPVPSTPTNSVPTSNSIAAPTAPATANFYGEWSGQAQYQARSNGQQVPDAHAVVDLVISIDPRGKVVGESPGNGCRALGLASPGIGSMLNLDVTLSGCRYAGFNRRLTGTFSVPPSQAYATFSLLAYETRPGPSSGMYEVKATMRR